jgi:hypothetical protein
VIITTYRIEKISDDRPYIWRYTARRAPVIFDHPYNADSERPVMARVMGVAAHAGISLFLVQRMLCGGQHEPRPPEDQR